MKQVLLGDTVNLLGIRKKVILVHSDSPNKGGLNVYMRAITQKEEDRLDKYSDKSAIYFYGDLDFNKASDIDSIKRYGLVETNNRGLIYSNFNYEEGLFGLVDNYEMGKLEKVIKWGPCNDPVAWLKYNHCLLGKPDKVMVYNDNYHDFFIGRR